MGHSKAVILIFLSLSAALSQVEPQASGLPQNNPSLAEANSDINFHPSLPLVIGLLSVMFGLTFALLIYAKFRHSRPVALHIGAIVGISSRFSGIDKTVIESLPFFRFSSLKGSKQGLECAVCLSKFEDIETLRLLAICKHAFHINCIDQWLEKHSSCPLCRQKINPEDPAIFAYTNSMRFSMSQGREGSNLELYVQREEANQGSFSSRSSIGRSIRKSEKEDEIRIQHHEPIVDDDEEQVLHNLNHGIIASDVVFKNRWSNVSSSDLMFLNSELLTDMSSNRFSSLEANETVSFEDKVSPVSIPHPPSLSDPRANVNGNNTARIANPERRSMSEITALSRFRETITGNTSNGKEERRRRLWLPIGRRTAEWYANSEMRSDQQLKATTQHLDLV